MVRSGCLSVGDVVVSGTEVARVRALLDHTGTHVDMAMPSTAVQLTGFKDLAAVGEDVISCENEEIAQQVVKTRREQQDADKLQQVENVSRYDHDENMMMHMMM